MMTTRGTRADEGRRRGWRLGAALVVVVATLAALALPASGWIRARSNINIDADAVAVCSSTVRLSAELRHESSSFEFFYPDFAGVPGVTPYPGLAQESIDLYGTQLDALGTTNAIATVVVPRTFRALDGGSYFFSGEGETPTPSGFGNGDFIYASAFDESFNPIAVPLKIGDPVYGCPPEDLLWAVLPGKVRGVNEVQVNAYLPHSFVFDASAVDPKTLVVTADGEGPPAAVSYVGNIGAIGIARVDLNDTGLDCGTKSLRLSGNDADGYAYQDDIEVFATGRNCPS